MIRLLTWDGLSGAWLSSGSRGLSRLGRGGGCWGVSGSLLALSRCGPVTLTGSSVEVEPGST